MFDARVRPSVGSCERTGGEKRKRKRGNPTIVCYIPAVKIVERTPAGHCEPTYETQQGRTHENKTADTNAGQNCNDDGTTDRRRR